MREKVRWGVLGVAAIATNKVIPAMQKGQDSEVVAIASRDLGRARQAAGDLGIPKAFGSYEEMLADPEIEAVYNPLPNHLHVPWSIRAAGAGKHVLCEKPIALSVAQTRELIGVRDRTGVKIGEAFMVGLTRNGSARATWWIPGRSGSSARCWASSAISILIRPTSAISPSKAAAG